MKKVAIFVDVQNIYYTTKQSYQKHFDYNAFWAKATSNRIIVGAFQQILRNIGFNIKLKPYIQRSDGSAKGDWDVGITLDVIEYATKTDIIVLLSGDGDFDLLVNKARATYPVIVEVYGVPALTSPSLINAANQFIAIDDNLLL